MSNEYSKQALELEETMKRYLRRLDLIQLEYDEKIDKLIKLRDKELSIYWELLDRERKKIEVVNDEVFEGETEALNKLYRDVGLPVEDIEPTDD